MSGTPAALTAVSLGSMSRDNPLSQLSHALLSWWEGAGPEDSSVLQLVLLEAEFIPELVIISLPLFLPRCLRGTSGDWHFDAYRDRWRQWRHISGQCSPVLAGALHIRLPNRSGVTHGGVRGGAVRQDNVTPEMVGFKRDPSESGCIKLNSFRSCFDQLCKSCRHPFLLGSHLGQSINEAIRTPLDCRVNVAVGAQRSSNGAIVAPCASIHLNFCSRASLQVVHSRVSKILAQIRANGDLALQQ